MGWPVKDLDFAASASPVPYAAARKAPRLFLAWAIRNAGDVAARTSLRGHIASLESDTLHTKRLLAFWVS